VRIFRARQMLRKPYRVPGKRQHTSGPAAIVSPQKGAEKTR
jgi:hypothetical protein